MKSEFALRILLKAVKYLPHLTAFFVSCSRNWQVTATPDPYQFVANFAGWGDFLDYGDYLADIPVEGNCQIGGLSLLEIDN